MSDTKPYIAVDNLLYLNRDFLFATAEDTDHDVELLADLILGTFWRPGWTAHQAGAVYTYVYPVTGQLLPANWYFGHWTNGAAVAPDGWTLDGGAGGTIARNASNNQIGAYCAAVTRAGTNVRLYQAVYDATLYRGLQLTAGMQSIAGAPAMAYVSIYDGTTRWDSAAHTGGGTKEWLTVTANGIDPDATTIVIEAWVKVNGTAYFDGALLVDGSSITEPPHEEVVTHFAVRHDQAHQGAGTAISLEYSSDNFSASSVAATFTPTTKGVTFKYFSSISAKYWRQKTLGATYSQPPELSFSSFGTTLTLPAYPDEGWNPYLQICNFETPKTAYGIPLGRLCRAPGRRLDLVMRTVSQAQLTALADLKAWAFTNGRPFVLCPNYGSRPTEAWVAWVPDGARWSAPETVARKVRRFSLPMEVHIE